MAGRNGRKQWEEMAGRHEAGSGGKNWREEIRQEKLTPNKSQIIPKKIKKMKNLRT
jgi:hypothetical protein